MKKAAILHTTSVTLSPLKAIADRIMPDVEIVNILDDSLLRDVMKNGGPNEAINARIAYYVKCAEEAGCRTIMSACSSIGESVEKCRFMTSMPVLRIDEAMAEMAAESGKIIGVVATVETTLNPTANIIVRKAKEKNREITVERHLLSNAYKALIGGDGDKHDAIILECLKKMMGSCDVIVLAQASMARVLNSIDNLKVPILTSPELGMNKLKGVLSKL